MVNIGDEVIVPVHVADMHKFGMNTEEIVMKGKVTYIPSHRRFACCEFELPNGQKIVEDYQIIKEQVVNVDFMTDKNGNPVRKQYMI